MAHYKKSEREQGLFLTVNLNEQLVPGTYEHTLDRLIDKMNLIEMQIVKYLKK